MIIIGYYSNLTKNYKDYSTVCALLHVTLFYYILMLLDIIKP